MSDDPAPLSPAVFLRNPFYFLVTLAVLITTVFSWFNLNSYCIFLFVACGIWSRKPLPLIKAVFTDKLFLAYFLFFLIEAAGLFYTHNMRTATNGVEKSATLLAIASILCAGSFAGQREYRKLMAAYCGVLFFACLYCLAAAFRTYQLERDPSVFFYHPLTHVISQNAVFFSVYMLFGMLFLLSPGADTPFTKVPVRARRAIKIFLVVFFMIMIVLLSSKLCLVIALLMLGSFFFRRFSFRRNKRYALAFGVAVVLLVGVLFLTDNFIRGRYQELVQGNMAMIKTEQFNPGVYFNAVQLRVLEWRFAGEILNERHAWLFGVSPGDSQDLLDQKYIHANMYIGNPADGPHRKIRGYIGYNFHNQYIETLVRSGIIGLLALLVILGLLIALVLKNRTREAFFTVFTLVLFFIPEAPLTMQHGVFLFCFFPLLLRYSGDGSAPVAAAPAR